MKKALKKKRIRCFSRDNTVEINVSYDPKSLTLRAESAHGSSVRHGQFEFPTNDEVWEFACGLACELDLDGLEVPRRAIKNVWRCSAEKTAKGWNI